MVGAVPGQERNRPPAHRTDGDGRRRRPVRRVDGHMGDVVEELVEARPAEHADLGYESEQTFVVQVPDAGTTTVAFTADDDGDLPEYEPEIQLELKTEK